MAAKGVYIINKGGQPPQLPESYRLVVFTIVATVCVGLVLLVALTPQPSYGSYQWFGPINTSAIPCNSTNNFSVFFSHQYQEAQIGCGIQQVLP